MSRTEAVSAPDTPTGVASHAVRQDIQALRAVAVLLVLAYHLWPGAVPGGYVGVDAFFVISGYLITGHLAREYASRRLSLRDFWIRRARRLLPSSFLVLGVSALVTLAWFPRYVWSQAFREIAASVLYVQNWVLARDAVDYLASSNRPSIVQHYWTLSMEEQFYIVLPLLLVLLLRARLRATSLPVVLAGLAAASFACSVYLTARNQPYAYFATTTRAWEFAVGGVLATAHWRAPRRLRPIAFWSGVALVIGASLTFGETTAFPGYLATLPVAGAALVLWARVESGIALRGIALRPVQLLGDISYALYLWHWPLVLVAPRLAGGERPWHGPLLAASAILLAWLTTRFVEDPFRRRPIARRSGRNALVATLAAASLVLAIAGYGLRSIRVDAEAMAALTGAARDADPSCFGAAALTRTCPPAASVVPDVDLVERDGANRGECWSNNGDDRLRICTLGPQSGYDRRLFAVGDSHGNALISAYEWIAKEANWRIDVAGKGGCYLTTANIRQYQESYRADCRNWQRQVRAHLNRNEPYDALLVTHLEGFELLLEDLPPFETEVRGLVGAWSRPAERGTRIIAIKDVPKMPDDTVECVQRHGVAAERECAVERAAALRVRDSQAEAVRQVPGARLVDLDDLYCGARCSPVVGGVAVYASRGHLTATYARTLAPYLLVELRAALE